MKWMIVLLATLVASPAAAQAVRAKADVDCASAGQTLLYDCTIRLTNARTGAALSGVTVSVGADMPSMPGAHNVRPVKAAEQAEKGTYKVQLELEMHGDWAVRLDLSGPIRDRVISVLRFEGAQVGPANPAAPAKHGR
jgi:hypothetical protein